MGLLAGITGALQGAPKIPPLEELQLGTEQGKAIKANIEALPQTEKLASGVNTFNQQQIEKMLAAAIPQFNELRSGVSSDIGKMLKGELPLGDIQQSQLKSVAKSFGGGFGGSGAGGNLVARDLGLREVDVMQKGLSEATNWFRTMAAIEQPGMFNVSSMFITPMQQYETHNQQNLQEFQRQWAQNMADWQTSPGYLAGMSMQGIDDIVSSAAGGWLGGLGGMMGGATSKSGGSGASGSFGSGGYGAYGKSSLLDPSGNKI